MPANTARDEDWDTESVSGTHKSPSPKSTKKVLAEDERSLKVAVKHLTVKLLRSRAALDDVTLSVAADAALVRGLTPDPKPLSTEEMLSMAITRACSKTTVEKLERLRASRHISWGALVAQTLEALLIGEKPPPPRPTPITVTPTPIAAPTTKAIPWDSR